jgi:hypothetical protein
LIMTEICAHLSAHDFLFSLPVDWPGFVGNRQRAGFVNKIQLSSKHARCAYPQVREMREQMLKAETLRFHTAIRLIAEESGAASDEVRSIRRLEAGYVL